MENFFNLVPLIVVLPAIGLLINLFAGKYLGEKGVGIVAVGASVSAFFVSGLLWIALVDTGYEAAVVNMPLLDGWIRIPSAGVEIPWQFRVDTLSVTMMLVVTGVGSLIHLYAVGYMHGDERFPRFFVYLNLFLVFMLTLVGGNNYLMMFVGWEGVGLCSFLLIGFWFDKPGGEGWKNSDAARKAFIANRVGDFGMVIAMLLTFWTFGTLDFYKPHEVPIHAATHAAEVEEPVFAPEVEPEAEAEAARAPVGPLGVFNQAHLWLEEGGHEVDFGLFTMSLKGTLTIITLLFLLGATGKSAQIPLFVWLPDAMAGPTPVSALIHAATMVTAGVYMMVRSNVLFHAADVTSFVVTIVGATTALMAGFIAMGQWDIKKVLAYSTVSQLGFMVAAVGVGAYAAAMFHLITHAFFKALLFLGSGSVIHGVEHGHHHAHAHDGPHDAEPFDAQDMRNMGGLSRRMPITYWTYLIGTLALAGIIPFAGFWSKDEILLDSLKLGTEQGRLDGYIGFALLLAAAAFTAFYMTRQLALVFWGKPRSEAAEHASESGWVMTLPLMVLAVLSAVGGFLNVPDGFPLLGSLFGVHELTSWLEHSVVYAHAGSFNALLATIAVAVALGAMYVGRLVYNERVLPTLRRDPLETDPRTSRAFALANAKLYWDEFYFKYIIWPFRDAAYWLAEKLDWAFWHDFVHERVIYGSFQRATDLLSTPVDRGIIDRAFNGVGVGIQAAAARLRTIQTGFVRTYALGVLFGAVLVMFIILFPVIRELLGM
ncbi:MAG TPA: NADH-quinone oxidoreductase subunit L [Aggregatilineaceae bacterium]|nr:NADH-quinone oxidoreductase subunit L [Aggregatilineaceae bacterium]